MDIMIKETISRTGILLLVTVMTLIGLSEKAIGATRVVDAKTAEGYYFARYQSANPEDWGFLDIRIDGNAATVTGFFKMAEVKGDYNPETGIIRMRSGQITPYKMAGGSDLLWFFNHMETDNTQKPLEYAELIYVPAGEKNPNGKTYKGGSWYIDSNTIISVAERDHRFDWKNSFQMAVSEIESVNSYYDMKPFDYIEKEWEDCGKALFTDGWFAACAGEGFGAYEVECRKRGTEILLVDPYGKNSPYASVDPQTGFPYNISAATSHGFILMDIEDPDCVLVRPFVASGFNYNSFYGFKDGDGMIYPFDGYFTCTTKEGVEYYMKKCPIEYIKEDAIIYAEPIGRINSKGLITLPNTRVQRPDYSSWHSDSWTTNLESIGKQTRESRIQLPEAAYSSALEDISVVEDQPVRYFNLQGIEISEPAPGIPVIVRQGNKASKVIY